MRWQDFPGIAPKQRPDLKLKWEAGKKAHRHTWQRTERIKDGRRFYLQVCLDHEQDGKPAPVIRAYDLEVL